MQTVLIAEENADTRWTIKYNLLSKGYAVQEVSSGYQVLGAVRSCRPDLIILDAHLPGTDGIKVLHQLKDDSVGGEIPVLMLGHLGTNRNIYFFTRGLVEEVFNKRALNLIALMYSVQKALKKEVSGEPWMQKNLQSVLVA